MPFMRTKFDVNHGRTDSRRARGAKTFVDTGRREESVSHFCSLPHSAHFTFLPTSRSCQTLSAFPNTGTTGTTAGTTTAVLAAYDTAAAAQSFSARILIVRSSYI